MEQRKPIVRRRYSASQRADFVARYRQSGLTQAEFALRNDLKLCTLHQWLHRGDRSSKAPEPVFKEVFLPTSLPVAPPALEIHLGPDFTLKLRCALSPKFIAQLVQQLRRSC